MMETDVVQSNSFFKARITLISKSDKSIVNVINYINKSKKKKKHMVLSLDLGKHLVKSNTHSW